MIAIDSSALIAILTDEPDAERCLRALSAQTSVAMSAATMVESMIVGRRLKIEPELLDFLGELPLRVVPVDNEAPWRVNEIHRKWGKGNHPARLNIIDCFSYDVARQLGCPLLYIGNDFSQTDIPSALA